MPSIDRSRGIALCLRRRLQPLFAKVFKRFGLESEKGKTAFIDDKWKEKVNDLQNRVERLKGDLARAQKAKQAEHDKGKVKIKKLEEDFSRLLKAKESKEAKEAKSKVKTEVVEVSSDEGFYGDEDVVLFNDVKYPLSDAEIRMFKKRPTTSRAPTPLPQDPELPLLLQDPEIPMLLQDLELLLLSLLQDLKLPLLPLPLLKLPQDPKLPLHPLPMHKLLPLLQEGTGK
ncbi:hypothetical protein Tco_1378564 [Tanacetum coccineum]